MGALFTRGAPSCSSRKLWRSVTWDTLVGRVVCAVHDVRIPSAITMPQIVGRSEYRFIQSHDDLCAGGLRKCASPDLPVKSPEATSLASASQLRIRCPLGPGSGAKTQSNAKYGAALAITWSVNPCSIRGKQSKT